MKVKFSKALIIIFGVLLSAVTLHTNAKVKAEGTTPNVSLTTEVSNAVSQTYIIQPSDSSQSISLDKLVLRYYYSKSESKAESFFCDRAGLNLNVSPYYVDFSSNVTGTFHDTYLEISFTESYALSNGNLSLGIRFAQSDWSSYQNYKEIKLEVVYDGVVVKTELYGEDVTTTTPTPTATPTVTPTVTVTPTPTTTPTQTGCILPDCNVDQNGPFAVTIDKSVGPNGKGWVVRPTNLGTLGVAKHPIFIWNPGGGDPVSQYESQMKRWASQGFVVYSEESQWSGQQCKDGLNWIIQQNSNSQSPLYNKLDVTRIAAGGFSLGSVGAYEVASDPRIMTTIHCDGGSFDGTGYTKWRNPTCVMNGLADGGLASDNTNRDYANATVPIWYGGIIGGGHGSTVWDGGDAITGWLRWQVAGDTDLASMFLTPNGRFNTGIFKSQWKNW